MIDCDPLEKHGIDFVKKKMGELCSSFLTSVLKDTKDSCVPLHRPP